MGCFCKQPAARALQHLAALPLSELSAALPPIPKVAVGPLAAQLLASAAASATASANIQAAARLAASAKLDATLSMSAVANLEAAANVFATLGVSPIHASASARLALAVHSMNATLPKLLASSQSMLAPTGGRLAQISPLLALAQLVQQTLGVDLMQPMAPSQLSSAFEAMLSAKATATLSASMVANASMSAAGKATLQLSAHARVATAAQSMGINLALPGGITKLNAALKVAAGIPVPPLTVSQSQMGQLSAALSSVNSVATACKVDLAATSAANLLAVALKPLFDALSGITKLAASAKASPAAKASAKASAAASLTLQADATVQAAASATATASMQAALKAAAALNFQGLKIPPLTALANLNVPATLSADLSKLAGAPIMAQMPCTSCKFT